MRCSWLAVAWKLRPSEPADRIRLGQVLLGQGDVEQAENEFKQAVSLASQQS